MNRPALSRTQLGFTLVETMAALAVSGVLAAIGVPQLTGLMGAKAVDASVASLTEALRLAKSEAMKRGQTVSVCALAAPVNPEAPRCATSGKDWSAGWMVFADHGVRGRLDDGDQLIRVRQSTSTTTKVTATLRYITLQASGVSLSAASHFDFLPQGQADAYGARRVCINKPGRARVLASVTECAG